MQIKIPLEALFALQFRVFLQEEFKLGFFFGCGKPFAWTWWCSSAQHHNSVGHGVTLNLLENLEVVLSQGSGPFSDRGWCTGPP